MHIAPKSVTDISFNHIKDKDNFERKKETLLTEKTMEIIRYQVTTRKYLISKLTICLTLQFIQIVR